MSLRALDAADSCANRRKVTCDLPRTGHAVADTYLSKTLHKH